MKKEREKVSTGERMYCVNKINEKHISYPHINSIFRFAVHVCLLPHHFKLEADEVDRDCVFASEILTSACEERLCEIKS